MVQLNSLRKFLLEDAGTTSCSTVLGSLPLGEYLFILFFSGDADSAFQLNVVTILFFSLKDCNALYEKFLDVFAGKESCGEVEQEDYKEFLEMASHPIPEDMVRIDFPLYIVAYNT